MQNIREKKTSKQIKHPTVKSDKIFLFKPMMRPQPCCTYKLINAHLIVFLNYKNVIMYLALKLVILIFFPVPF